MMADPLFTPSISIKEEPADQSVMPDITIKNEPLSPPPQSILDQEYECGGVVPKTEPVWDDGRDADLGADHYHHHHGRIRGTSAGGTARTVCSINNSSTAATTGTAAPTASVLQATGTHQLRHQARFLDAVQTGNLSELEHLLDVGELNVNGFDADGQTALHRVCCEGNLAIVKLLVRFGADVRLCNKDGWAALHLACWGGNQNIVMYLLNALKTRAN